MFEHHRRATCRWNSLENAADNGGNLPVRINFLFHMVEFASDFQSGQIVAEVLVGQVASPPADKLRDYSTDARTQRQRPCGAALGRSTLAGLAAPDHRRYEDVNARRPCSERTPARQADIER